MFTSVLEKLENLPDHELPEEISKWCAQWDRLMGRSMREGEAASPFGVLLAHSTTHSPSLTQRLVKVLWQDHPTVRFSGETTHALRTAVSMLVATHSPVANHIVLAQACACYWGKMWSERRLSKHEMMRSKLGGQYRALGKVMDAMAYAYAIPATGGLSLSDMKTLFKAAGPVFVERCAGVFARFSDLVSLAPAFEGIPRSSAANIVLLSLRHGEATDITHTVMKNLSLNDILDEVRSQTDEEMTALETDRPQFVQICSAALSSSPEKNLQMVLQKTGPYDNPAREVFKLWKDLLEHYPQEALSPDNQVLVQNLVSFAQKHPDLNHEGCQQLERHLLYSVASATASQSSRKTPRKI